MQLLFFLRRNYQLVLLLLFFCWAANLMFSVLERARANDHRASCASRLKQITLDYKMYLQDSNDYAPPVKQGDKGWADILEPYVRDWEIFQCPATSSALQVRSTDYFYNTRVAHRVEVEFPEQTILLGDGDDNSDTAYHLAALPPHWKTDESSPAHRHFDGANYAFADGHVQWMRPSAISIQSPLHGNNGIATFAVR